MAWAGVCLLAVWAALLFTFAVWAFACLIADLLNEWRDKE